MGIYKELLNEISIPKVVKIRYNIPSDSIQDIEGEVIKTLEEKRVLDNIQDGNTVAIAVGSREISNLELIIKTLISMIQQKGGKPFIVPAMGSHGGASAEGQREVIANFGITEESLGIPIKSSMETVEIGKTETGIPANVDKYAYNADFIVPVGRIKPHTDFRGPYESGLMKMIAIGLGKQKGASICHQLGLENMSTNVYDLAKIVIKKANILFGLAIIENAFHGTYSITAIPVEEIENTEPKLLMKAKSLVPTIPFKKVDVIVVDEMGKDISGTRIDSNVVGRSSTLGISEPFAERIVVLDLTCKSHGNANGVGLADVITNRFFEKIKFDQTYPNAITSSETNAVKIPIVMPDDITAVRCAIKVCTKLEGNGVRLVRIKNTLSLNEFYISEALVPEAVENKDIQIIGDLEEMQDMNYF